MILTRRYFPEALWSASLYLNHKIDPQQVVRIMVLMCGSSADPRILIIKIFGGLYCRMKNKAKTDKTIKTKSAHHINTTIHLKENVTDPTMTESAHHTRLNEPFSFSEIYRFGGSILRFHLNSFWITIRFHLENSTFSLKYRFGKIIKFFPSQWVLHNMFQYLISKMFLLTILYNSIPTGYLRLCSSLGLQISWFSPELAETRIRRPIDSRNRTFEQRLSYIHVQQGPELANLQSSNLICVSRARKYHYFDHYHDYFHHSVLGEAWLVPRPYNLHVIIMQSTSLVVASPHAVLRNPNSTHTSSCSIHAIYNLIPIIKEYPTQNLLSFAFPGHEAGIPPGKSDASGGSGPK